MDEEQQSVQEGEVVDNKLAPLVSQEFLEECKSVVVETEFQSRWALVEGYHRLGDLILGQANPLADADHDKEMANLTTITAALAVELNKSERLIWYAIKFAKLYPDLNVLPEGKNTSWNKVVRKYLTTKKTPCTHPEEDRKDITITICTLCDKRIDITK